MEPGEESFYNSLSDDLDPAEPGDVCGIEQIHAGGEHYRCLNLMAGALSPVEDNSALVGIVTKCLTICLGSP